MRLRWLVLIVLASACGESAQIVAPDPMRVVFDPRQIILPGEPTPDGRYICPTDIAVKARGGRPDGVVDMTGIVIKFLDEAGFATQTNTARPVDWFGSDRLTFDQRLVAHRTVNGPAAPIRVQVVLTYSGTGLTSSADTLSITCG